MPATDPENPGAVTQAERVDYIRESYLVDASPGRLEFRLAGDLIAVAAVTGNAAGVLCAEAGPGRTLAPDTLAAFTAAARAMWRLAFPQSYCWYCAERHDCRDPRGGLCFPCWRRWLEGEVRLPLEQDVSLAMRMIRATCGLKPGALGPDGGTNPYDCERVTFAVEDAR